MINYISLNINKLVSKENLSKDAFGRLFDLKRGAISSYIDGKALPKIETLQKISARYDISIDELVNSEIDLTKERDISLNEEAKSKKAVPFWNLPVSAGHSIEELIAQKDPDGFIKGLPGIDIAENILPVVGTSMEPEISNGSIIGVKRINNWESLNTERIYLIITYEDRMIKRIEYDNEDENILWCISPNYPKFKIYKADIVEIQRVCFVYNPR